MPSAHSAVAVSITTMIGSQGFSSPFCFSVFSMVVLYDAVV
ncbi:MAG: divergent PAP2 family protein [Clostridia bacterium]